MGENLQQLEREVEAARAKLAGDLSTLRSPATLTDFTESVKEEALDAKNALVDKATASARSVLDDMLDTVKAKAAANPTAVLAIGAGIAWRLIHRPPIASALIGAGLLSLLRTEPARVNGHTDAEYIEYGKRRLRRQATDFAETVRDRATAAGAALQNKAGELADAAKDRAQQLRADAQEAAHEALGAARQGVRRLSADAESAAYDAADDLRARGAALADRASSRWRELRASPTMSDGDWDSPFPETVSERDTRDTVLLGAAGIAVVTALGLAYQRRMREDAEVE
jgi:hypothetical protein